jgi:hypothetical protein
MVTAALSEGLFGLLGIHWLCIIIWGIMAGIFICIAKFMIGRFLQEEKIKTEATAELLDLAVIFVMVMFIGFIESTGVNFITLGFGINSYGEIQDYVVGNLNDAYTQLDGAQKVALDNLDKKTNEMITKNSVTFIGMPLLAWFGGLDRNFFMDMAKWEYIARTSIQLKFWTDASIGVIGMLQNIAPLSLTVGFFFRAFKWSKGFGGFLIVLAVSIYYVYPIVFYALFNDFSAPDISTQKVQLNGCGYNVITLSNPVVVTGSSIESMSAVMGQGSIDYSSGIADFVNSVYLGLFLSHSIALAATLMFLYHGTLILGSGMLTSEFEGRLTRLM